MVPAGQPVHRALSGRADARTRLEWVRRIFCGEGQVRVFDWEVDAKRPMPTIETLRHVHSLYPDRQPVLLLGADAFASMASWVDYPAHLRLCDVAVFPRRGQPAFDAGKWQLMSVSRWRRTPGHGRVIRVDVMLPDISATQLRTMAEEGRSLRGLVPEVVRQDIEGAYRVPRQEKDIGRTGNV